MSVKKVKDVVDTKKENDVTVETPEVEIPEVENNTKSDIEVDVKKAEVKKENIPVKDSVKIRMRVDHKCVIAMERYDLKAGKTYNVPSNVKRILNKAGVLAPL